jgi:extracellular elastinolytic metalloproteinase
LGTNDPSSGTRKLLVDPHHKKASPAGWHTTGSNSNETRHTVTAGNNVFAQENADGGSDWKDNYRPNGKKSLVFDFPVNFKKQPSTYLDAAITNLFYLNNVIHDLFCEFFFCNDIATSRF